VASEATALEGGALQADLDLARRLQQADQSAYAQLCQRFGPALHGFAASCLGGDDELAEEVMIQTMTDAVRNIRRFDPRKAGLATWLYGIARRQVVAQRRKLTRRKSVPRSAQVSMDVTSELPAAGDLAGDLAARVDAHQQVAFLSEALSDLEMQVLILHCVDEFSLKEIARIVRRSEKAVDSLLHRARQKARERLAQDAE